MGLFIFAIVMLVGIGSVFPHNVSVCLNKIEVYDTLAHPESLDHLRTKPDDPDTIRMLLSLSSSKTRRSPSAYEYSASTITMAYAELCQRGGFGNKTFQ